MLNTAQINYLKTIRKTLHTNPELSEKEYLTQQIIIDFLNEKSNFHLQKIADTGVLATFESENSGPTVLIRGDIDALPILETNTFEHISNTKGISHKCGHDGHTTILLGLAQLITEKPLTKGKLLLLFQPAEENGSGAKKVLKNHLFINQKIDYAFALHNLPGYSLNEIIVKNKEFTSNVKSVIIKLKGKTAHAAEPQNGINPSMAISEILAFANQITNNNPSQYNYFLMTPVFSKLGEENSYGISAGYAEMHFTIRSWSTSLMKRKSDEITLLIKDTCKKYQLSTKISWTEEFYANINHPDAVEIIKKAGIENNLKLTEKKQPFTWGEDFGLFTQKFKGAMFGLGAGKNAPALHNPDYDFPDEITQTGIKMFYSIIQQTL